MRRPISDALGRHLGFTVNLAVVVDVDAALDGTEVPDPPGALGNGAANGSATGAGDAGDARGGTGRRRGTSQAS